ncbi:MAG: penicillin-binding protein activator [Deltaproteobacteria bacterium]|nr:penicillin-binding protein activator [Deltaproteobacteria bacterium]
MIRRTARVLPVLLAALFLASLPTASPGADDPVPSIVQQARSVAPQDRREALAILEDYLARSPRADLLPWVMLEAGEQRRLAGDATAARVHFLRVRDTFPSHLLHDAAVLGIALADAGDAPSPNQEATLGLLEAQGAPPTLHADRWRLLAWAAWRRGERGEAVHRLVERAREAAEQAGDPVVLDRVARLVEATEPGVPQPGLAPEGADLLAQAQEALARDDFQGARRLANRFLEAHPASPDAREARYVLARVEQGDRQDPTAVGVILPLSGPFALPGQRIRQVLEFALARTGSKVRLHFEDAEASPEDTVTALERLVLEKHVVAVIGPLLKENAAVAAEAAQALRIPILLLSQAEDLTRDRPWVFRVFLTPEKQVRALLDHAIETQGITHFGVLAPDNAYGHLVADCFAACAAERQAQVLRTIFYDPEAGDFRMAARELATKDYKARAAEFAHLKAIARARGADPDKVVLPPEVAFQAIFIPDGWQRVALVASALAYEEYAVGSFRPTRGAAPMLLMGLNGWHDDQLAVDGAKYVRGSIFVDAFDPRDETPAVGSFVEAYHEAFHRDPGVLDAIVYDALRFVVQPLTEGAVDRHALREALTRVVLEDPVAGGDRFDADRDVVYTLRVFRVGVNRIEPWIPELPSEDLPEP